MRDHKFKSIDVQDTDEISRTIPIAYLSYFKQGQSLE